MIEKLLKERNIPPLMKFSDGREVKTIDDWRMRRTEIIDILSQCEYGYSPEVPVNVVGTVLQDADNHAGSCAGKAEHSRINLKFETQKGEFSFDFDLIVPVRAKKAPVFLVIAFRPDIPDRYLPLEELIDNGYAVATFEYVSISKDYQYGDGLADCYDRDDRTGWGKISVWAWAASRIMDYLMTLDNIDTSRVAVVGHSRLGKAAHWCGGQDERFSMVISNDSGCAGASMFRGKIGERISHITDAVPSWFCGNFLEYVDRENELPFDQHFLLSLTADPYPKSWTVID